MKKNLYVELVQNEIKEESQYSLNYNDEDDEDEIDEENHDDFSRTSDKELEDNNLEESHFMID